jgi:hypothetical protein
MTGNDGEPAPTPEAASAPKTVGGDEVGGDKHVLSGDFRGAEITIGSRVTHVTQLPQSLLDYDSPQHRRNQENVTANVRTAYIDGVLRESMPERAQLELALDSPPGKLQRTIALVEGREPRRPVESANDVEGIFKSSGQRLLILGAPGSGKTITLIELCEPLLIRAEADPLQPVPVILNLSTWAQKQPPLGEWIVEEMWRQYGLARQVTPVWLAADHLILLLDGLDEVAPDARDACVRATNAFREAHGAGLVVCSRSADYAELSEWLALSRAVEILPLSPAQVDAYLSHEALDLSAVREAIARDDALRELSTTPLMLNVMAVAYGGRPFEELLPLLESEEDRRAHLYDAYIRRVFKRRPLNRTNYSSAQALRWLRFVAQQLKKHKDTQLFFIEELQPDWLLKRQHQWYQVLVVALFGVLLFPISLLLGIVFGIYAAKREIHLVDKLEINISSQSIGVALTTNRFFGVLFGLLFYLTGSPGGVVGGILVGILIGVLFNFLSPITIESEIRDRPNVLTPKSWTQKAST